MNYILKRNTRSKHIRIRLNHQGELVATAPKHIPKFVVSQFVKKSQPWIERQRQKQSLAKLAHPVIDWQNQIVSFKGKLYYFKFDTSFSEKVIIGNKYLHIHPVTGFETDVKKTLLVWLKKQAELYILQSLKHHSQDMKVSFLQVRFRQQSSRWGSCSSRGNLNFNWRLIHFHPKVIDYVIIHELAHLKHHDHSKAFWNVVKQFCPCYKDHVNFLKSQSLAIE